MVGLSGAPFVLPLCVRRLGLPRGAAPERGDCKAQLANRAEAVGGGENNAKAVFRCCENTGKLLGVRN